jgi:hypothetical protein
MGKQKKRVLHKTNSSLYMTREDAISSVCGCFIKKNSLRTRKAQSLVALFGLSAEELSEAGIEYEYLKSLKI